jgi:hypothetical protein
MDLFIPLIIFWVVSSVIRGMQQNQRNQQGGPPGPPVQPRLPGAPSSLPPRPRIEPARPKQAPAQTRPVRQEATRPIRGSTMEREAMPSQREKPGRIPAPDTAVRLGTIAPEGSVPVKPGPTFSAPATIGEQKTSPAAREVFKVLKRKDGLATAVLLAEVLGPPRAMQPFEFRGEPKQ